MADLTPSLPVSKDKNANAVGNPFFVSLSDGAAALARAEDTASGAGHFGIPFLGIRNDADAALTDTDGDYGMVSIDSAGRLKVVATVVNNAERAEDAAHTTGDTGLFILAVRNSAQGALTTTDLDYSPIAVDASGRVFVDIAVQSLTALKVSKDGNANSEDNPIFVAVTAAVSGKEVNDYKTAAAVAAGAADNHDYASVATTFLLMRVWASASGAIKVEVQVGPIAGLVSKAVGFSSMANPNIDIEFNPPIEVPTTGTGTTRVIVTNKEPSAMDVYSTILGRQV